ncbi:MULTISPECIES: hypothetical protein [unclassified Lysinibacillus]|uniref:hypothetical protein n=1 Tax=unclassified Lysinibacillus TaxID=2636778 RepID=UPI002554559D|nr:MULTISPECIES: hypothetical protein [unclassified Lysinibacillus]MDM5247996.1 hypothetical protein [Lysinibacillus sp. G4S2]
MINKKIKFSVIFFGLLLLTACEGETFILYGESENWAVQYEVEKSADCQPTSGYIKFIGTQPNPKKVEYDISNSTGDVPIEENGTFTLPNGCTNATEDSKIEAVIKWDSHSETIPLTNKSK